jgi:hypothetical protein
MTRTGKAGAMAWDFPPSCGDVHMRRHWGLSSASINWPVRRVRHFGNRASIPGQAFRWWQPWAKLHWPRCSLNLDGIACYTPRPMGCSVAPADKGHTWKACVHLNIQRHSKNKIKDFKTAHPCRAGLEVALGEWCITVKEAWDIPTGDHLG